MEYASLRGTADGMDLSVITELARYFESEIGYDIPPRTPFMGRSFNATRAGIHADGMLKDPEIYSIFDTEKILNRPANVLVGAHSGAAGIAHWINEYFYIEKEIALSKRSDVVLGIKELVDKEYANGRTTLLGDTELEDMVLEVDADLYDKLVHRRKKKTGRIAD
jgi:isopropylmalate/homocitrate/citramalate synthase